MAPLLLPKSPFAATLYTPPAGVPSNQTPSTHAHTSTVETETPSANAPAEQSTQDAAPPSQTAKPKKRKRKDAEKPHILLQSTFRKPTWSYFHLSLITPGAASLPPHTTATTSTNISPLTALPLLTQPLKSYLGTTGTAIPIDILKTAGRDVFVRVPRQDARGLRASLSAWIGSCDGEHVPGVGDEDSGVAVGKVKVAWRVVGEGAVLGGLVDGGDGGELFR